MKHRCSHISLAKSSLIYVFWLFCCSRHGYDPPLAQFSFAALPNTPVFMIPSYNQSSCSKSKHDATEFLKILCGVLCTASSSRARCKQVFIISRCLCSMLVSSVGSRVLHIRSLSYSRLPSTCTDRLGSLGTVGCCRHVHE